MGNPPTKPVDGLLPRQAPLLRRCRWLAHLDREMKRCLPAPLDQHCRLANVRGGDLIIHIDSPAWSTRLRYHGPRLIRHMKALPGLSSIRKVCIRVVPPPPPPRTAPRRLSKKAVENLIASAEAMPPGPLRDAFLRLARR
ncbi:MAG: DUF721 domain-containing protein [Gammaproteobacteria bacterium]|nr:MAG: DUF721 domain-containing protein [Gammaproteobacteria bacterium]